jgi:hypothetical protein
MVRRPISRIRTHPADHLKNLLIVGGQIAAEDGLVTSGEPIN